MNIEQIRQDLIDNVINYSEAFELIKKLPKPWNTKEWAIKRSTLIKNYCEQCNIEGEVFVAQHLTHPENFSRIKTKLLYKKLVEYYSKNVTEKPTVTTQEIGDFIKKFSEKRTACPNCKKLTYRERKTMTPKYFCENCKTYFEHTTTIEYISIFKSISNYEQVASYIIDRKHTDIKQKIQNKVFEEHENEIGKIALLKSIDLHFKYVSLENIVTFCKKCASRMDFSTQLLCWSCKKNYFNYDTYDNCYECFENKRTAINPYKEKIRELLIADQNSS